MHLGFSWGAMGGGAKGVRGEGRGGERVLMLSLTKCPVAHDHEAKFPS